MLELTTPRLLLRRLTTADAAFILELVNDPDWLQFIGDRGVKNLQAARTFIQTGPQAMYAQSGLGLLMVQSLTSKHAMGLCGLLQRDYLDYPDIGFAFLPPFRGQGYAFEAADAVIQAGLKLPDVSRIGGITALDNQASMQLLKKLGLSFEKVIKIDGHQQESNLFITP